MFEIALKKIRCIKDTYGPGDDEPYVIVFAADLANRPSVGAKSTLYGPYEGNQSMAAGDVRSLHNPELCWGFDGQPRDIADPGHPIILIGLMESDHDLHFANAARSLTHTMMLGATAGYVGANMDRGPMVEQLRADMEGALDTARKLGIEHDERLGPVLELRLTQSDLAKAESDVVQKTLKFISKAEDSEYDLTFAIGTGVGSVSSALGSSGAADRYAAIWVKASGPSWVARHRMTSDEYQHEFNQLSGQGFRLVRVSGYNIGGQARFAAIWEQSAGPVWVARHNMTSAQYQEEFNKLAQDGYRLKQVSGYHGSGQDLYAAIWVKESGPNWVARHRMTTTSYQVEFSKLAQQGFRLVDVSTYPLNSGFGYAAIWERRRTLFPWVARHGMSSAEYQKEFTKLTGEGFRLVHVDGGTVGATRRFAAIWEKSGSPPWVARHDMASGQYQVEFEKYAKQAYRLVRVSGY